MNASEIIRAAIALATLAGLGLLYASDGHSAAREIERHQPAQLVRSAARQ